MNTRLYRPRLAVLGILVAMFVADFAQSLRAQNLLVNPGFEDTSGLTSGQQNFINAVGYLPISPPDSTTLNGWSVVNNPLVLASGNSSVDLVNSTFLVHTGNYAIDMVGTGVGSSLGEIQQTVNLAAGSYVLSFWVAHFEGTADSNPYLTVSIGGVLAQGVTLPTASLTWQQVTINFNIATTGNYTLDFAALRELDRNSGAYLDDISISVPEPSTVWMGALTLGLASRLGWKRLRWVRALRAA